MITALGSFYFTYWIAGALTVVVSDPTEPGISPTLAWAPVVVAAVVAAGATHFVWTRAGVPGGFVSTVAKASILTGTVAFSAGFFGPILLMPTANQGPLLGLLITGPLGFVTGAVGGALYWAMRRRPQVW